jgi:peroxiredoxin
VPEDRFADLGPDRPPRDEGRRPAEPGEEPERRSAAERFAELDERDPEPQPRRAPEPARPGGRYGWVVGIAFLIVIVLGGVNALRNSGEGFRGIKAGDTLPDFAAPAAVGGRDDRDVNVQIKEQDDVPAACDVHGPGVVNVCDLRREKPVVVTFVANATRGCEDQLDRVERVRREFPTVAYVGVVSRRKQPEAERLVREHRWGFPIAVDRDAQLFNIYRIGDCPTTVFAYRGGVSRASLLGELDVARLREESRALLRPAPAPTDR